MQKTLVLRLINAKQYPEAEAAMETYLQNFPEDEFMRKMLAIAKQDCHPEHQEGSALGNYRQVIRNR